MKKFIKELYLISSLLFTPLTAYANRTIILDAGHDKEYYSGARYGKYKEVNSNVNFSKRLRNHLEKNGFNVVETYNENGYNTDVVEFEKSYRKVKPFKKISSRYQRLLYARGRFSDPQYKINLDNKKYEAELFLSIHTDDNGNEQGFTLYAPYNSNSESLRFARIMKKKLESNGFNGWKNGAIKKAGFIVIENSPVKVPRILFERGFMSNPKERYNLFNNEEWNEKMATAVEEAIKEYFNK